MPAELTREDLNRLAAYAARRAAEWSRDMDCEQAIAEPDERCAVTIWELQRLVAAAAERDAAQADLEIARDRIKDAEQIIDTVRRCTVSVGGVVLKGLLDAYAKKWGAK